MEVLVVLLDNFDIGGQTKSIKSNSPKLFSLGSSNPDTIRVFMYRKERNRACHTELPRTTAADGAEDTLN